MADDYQVTPRACIHAEVAAANYESAIMDSPPEAEGGQDDK